VSRSTFVLIWYEICSFTGSVSRRTYHTARGAKRRDDARGRNDESARLDSGREGRGRAGWAHGLGLRAYTGPSASSPRAVNRDVESVNVQLWIADETFESSESSFGVGGWAAMPLRLGEGKRVEYEMQQEQLPQRAATAVQ